MRINRVLAWLLVLGVIALLTVVGGLLFLASLLDFGRLVPWYVGFFGTLMALGAVVGGIVYVASGFKPVPEAERWVIEIFGSFSRVARPGLTILLPGIEKVRSRQTTKEQFVSVDTKDTITFDNAKASFLALLYFVLNPDDEWAAYKATYAFETEGKDPEEAIKSLCEAALRSIAGTKELSFLKNNQKELNDLVLDMIQEKMLNWGFVVKTHIIKELIPSKEVGDAIEEKLIAEAKGAAAVATATAQAQATVIAAEADLQRRTKAAEAKKVEEEKDAEGDAGALKALQGALGGDHREAARFRLGEKAVESGGGTGAIAAAIMSILSTFTQPRKP